MDLNVGDLQLCLHGVNMQSTALHSIFSQLLYLICDLGSSVCGNEKLTMSDGVICHLSLRLLCQRDTILT